MKKCNFISSIQRNFMRRYRCAQCAPTNINSSLLEFIPHKDAGQGQVLKGEKQ